MLTTIYMLMLTVVMLWSLSYDLSQNGRFWV